MRAASMHAARLQGNLPLNVQAPPRDIYIGCSGWYYRDWKGCFYPPNLADKNWFPYYSDNFSTVELNAPFYSWPTVATVKNWVRQAKDKPFVYTIKVNELITHTKRFRHTKTLIRDFGYIADLLGPRMGCFLFQIPPSYDYSPARLRSIVEQLDLIRRNVVEFRHASWWNEKVYTAFREAGIIFCSCSGPRLPDELVRTADDIYLRFHGTQKWYRHDYSKEELVVWTKHIKDSGAKRVWVYFNNDYNCYAVENARELMKQLDGSKRKLTE